MYREYLGATNVVLMHIKSTHQELDGGTGAMSAYAEDLDRKSGSVE